MNLYIDGDAFPNLLKPIVFRAIERLSLQAFVISNKEITIGESKHIIYIIVGPKLDEADNRIVEMVKEGVGGGGAELCCAEQPYIEGNIYPPHSPIA